MKKAKGEVEVLPAEAAPADGLREILLELVDRVAAIASGMDRLEERIDLIAQDVNIIMLDEFDPEEREEAEVGE